jgi:hypothetical protein
MRPEELVELYRLIAQLRERKAKLKNMFYAAIEVGQLSNNPWKFDAISATQVLAEWEALK